MDRLRPAKSQRGTLSHDWSSRSILTQRESAYVRMKCIFLMNLFFSVLKIILKVRGRYHAAARYSPFRH